MKTQMQKSREYAKNHIENSLRYKLEELKKSNKRACVLYKDNIVGLGKAEDLLDQSSLSFKGLLHHNIKETITGVTTYIIL